MAPILLESVHPTINWVNTRERIGYHTHLISGYSSASKCLHVYASTALCLGSTMANASVPEANQVHSEHSTKSIVMAAEKIQFTYVSFVLCPKLIQNVIDTHPN